MKGRREKKKIQQQPYGLRPCEAIAQGHNCQGHRPWLREVAIVQGNQSWPLPRSCVRSWPCKAAVCDRGIQLHPLDKIVKWIYL